MANNTNPFDDLSNRLERIETLLDTITKGNEKNSNKNEPDHLTIDEASIFTRIPKKTLYQYTSKRIIPYIKSGKRLLFRRTDLLAWLNSRSQ